MAMSLVVFSLPSPGGEGWGEEALFRRVLNSTAVNPFVILAFRPWQEVQPTSQPQSDF
jgi:hypothetical protein